MRSGGNRRPQLEPMEQQPGLVDDPRQSNLLPFVVEGQHDLAGWSIGDPAVERILENSASVEFRCPVALQTAADNQLIKTIQKTQAARVGQRHELRMDRSLDGRLPADVDRARLPTLAQPPFPNAHPPRRQHYEAESTVVDFDAIDSFSKSASHSRLTHVEIVAGNAQFSRCEQKLGILLAAAGIEQCPMFFRHRILRRKSWFA
jgi:hypothetical protein